MSGVVGGKRGDGPQVGVPHGPRMARNAESRTPIWAAAVAFWAFAAAAEDPGEGGTGIGMGITGLGSCIGGTEVRQDGFALAGAGAAPTAPTALPPPLPPPPPPPRPSGPAKFGSALGAPGP